MPSAGSLRTSSAVVTPPEAITSQSTAAFISAIASKIRPLQHAVVGDVGVDDRGQRLAGELPGQVDRAGRARFQPAVGGDQAALGVDAEGELAGKPPARRRETSRALSGPACRRPAATGRAPSSRSIVASSRMPPPSSQGTSTAARIAWTAAQVGVRCRRERRRDRPGAGRSPLGRPSGGPFRPGRRHRSSRAGNRPAASARTCRREDRWPARSALPLIHPRLLSPPTLALRNA